MKGEVQNKKVLVRDKEVFIGVDVHKESWHVTARTEGEEIFHGGTPQPISSPSETLGSF